MKTTLILVAMLVMTNAVDFESLQAAIAFKAEDYAEPTCGNDDDFTTSINSLEYWHDLLSDGQLEMDEDLEVLLKARENIQNTKQFLQDADDGLVQAVEKEDEAEHNPEEHEDITEHHEDEHVEETDDDSEDDSETEDTNKAAGGAGGAAGEAADGASTDGDEFDWGGSEVPQVLIHEKKRHSKSFIQVVQNVFIQKLRNKVKHIIAIAQELDTDLGIQDYKERSAKKQEICDKIIEELDVMIDELHKLLNDDAYLLDVVTQLKEKEELLRVFMEKCGARIINLKDTSFVSKYTKVPHKILKNKHHHTSHKEVSFLQINQVFEEDQLNNELVNKQKQILQQQGMLGFLHNSGKRLRILDRE